MQNKHENEPGRDEAVSDARREYVPPRIEKVILALDETLSAGCKLGTDSGCVGPPITAYEGGS